MHVSRRGRAGARVACLVVTAFLLCPPPAYASDVTRRVVNTVNGVDVVTRVIGQLQGVQLGAGSATVTVYVNGRVSPVRIDFSDAAKALDQDATGGWMRLLAIPVLGTAMIKVLNLLSKVGRS